jgi:hypothetical protein
MSFGCLICTEVYETNEKTEKIPVILRKCGHVFHSVRVFYYEFYE